jgi:hypothetical protein
VLKFTNCKGDRARIELKIIAGIICLDKGGDFYKKHEYLKETMPDAGESVNLI